MKRKDCLAMVLFTLCFMSWTMTCLITPVGGWNPASDTYNEVYKTLFVITSLSLIGSILLLIIINKKS